jgi:beta-mannosidase
MAQTFRMPKDFPSLVYLSLVLQAEGIRYGVEHWRRNRARVSGTLIWQLNDCWPVASWSSIDYFGRWKALHYAAKRFYAPVLLSIEDAPPEMGLHVTSDLVETWTGAIRWSLETLDGQVVESGEENVSAAPLASTPIRALDFAKRVSDKNNRDLIFVAELWQNDQRIALSVATFIASKHLLLVDPGLDVQIRQEDGQLSINLTAQSLARFVELKLADADVVFSDNYFDVPAGREVSVTCPLPDGWTIDKARAVLQVQSLYDSFA